MKRVCQEHGASLLSHLRGDGKDLKSLILKKVEWEKDSNNNMTLKESKGPKSEITLKADLVLLAMGFLHPKKTNY